MSAIDGFLDLERGLALRAVPRRQQRRRSSRHAGATAHGADSSNGRHDRGSRYLLAGRRRRRQRRRGGRRAAMLGGLLVGVGELDHRRLAVGTAEERDPDRQPLRREAGRHDHRGDVDQERVEVRRALLVDVGRVDAVLDQRRRVLDRLVDDGVELVVGHHLHHLDHQLVARRRPRTGPGPAVRPPTGGASPCRSRASCGPPPSS